MFVPRNPGRYTEVMSSDPVRRAVRLSVFAAVLTIGMKATAYWLTGSAGLLSDALESGVNLVAAGVAGFALWYAARPADDTHSYGHDKIEYFSAGFEGALVLCAGFASVGVAADRFLHPKPVEQIGLGTVVAASAAGVNYVVARTVLRVGRQTGSVTLVADGHHLMTDVLTTAGVLVGLGLVQLTGYDGIDPLLAAGVGLHILFTGYRLLRTAVHGLMDQALPPDDRRRLEAAITAALPPGAAFHALRSRTAGRRTFAEFHLLVPGGMTVREGHDLAHQVEAAVAESFRGLVLAIHVEPIEDRKSWDDVELARVGGTPG
jgi:cation diffusion facilitator family transporter